MKLLAILLILSSGIGVQAQPTPEVTPDSTPAASDTRLDEYGIAQVYVPAGCFQMGITEEQAADVEAQSPPSWVLRELPSEQPQHEVCLTSGYWIDQYEVTNEAYAAFVDAGGYTTEAYWSEDGWEWLGNRNAATLPDDCDEAIADHPRVCVTWYEAEAYAHWHGGSLPTDAQWEYAARGEAGLIYPWGNEWDETLANVIDSEATTPVGSYPDGASWVGALDMAGNAMEWVQDWLDPGYYAESPREDPTGPETGRVKAERGGWWGSNFAVARTTYRHYEDPPSYQDHHIGFRIVTAAE